VVLVCTSGTAALNYAPAVAEAYYQQVPLLVLTADRPPEWIDQQDGQAIRQNQLYGLHAKAAYTLPADYEHPDATWHIERVVNEALIAASTAPYGPVHINVPIREPFYPSQGEEMHFRQGVKHLRPYHTRRTVPKEAWIDLMDIWEETERILVVAGQMPHNPRLIEALAHLMADYQIPVVADTTANLQELPDVIRHHDLFLANVDTQTIKALKPELLVTMGQSLLSKPLKQFLRQAAPSQHWHIQEGFPVPDPFRSLSHWIPMDAEDFFVQLFADLDFRHLLETEHDDPAGYAAAWQQYEKQAMRPLFGQLRHQPTPLHEAWVVGNLIGLLPQNTLLHAANSMAVRYLNLWGIPAGRGIIISANRGTSGIDGCTSTAVGAALANPDLPVVLITGDVAFFYDSNGLWHNYLPKNLRILLLNNQGGGIFRIIPGSRSQPELDEYFETRQQARAQGIAQTFGLDYQAVSQADMLSEALDWLLASATPTARLLEVSVDSSANAAAFVQFKQEATPGFLLRNEDRSETQQ
jgi:2-succinyl-5-enolpyruvyl-6-hydroxy-3-cyclohexene-1-carboxylate synthase